MKQSIKPKLSGKLTLSLVAVFLFIASIATAQTAPGATALTPKFSQAVAFNVSLPLQTLAPVAPRLVAPAAPLQEPVEIRPERGPIAMAKGHSGEGALQGAYGKRLPGQATIPAPLAHL